MTKADTALERIGRYRVVRRLTTGGHGEALLAKEEGPEREVVLKLLAPPPRAGDEFARTFDREAAACTRLVHPTIVQLYDFFPLSSVEPSVRRQGREGHLCMVLEYVEGPPLTRFRTSLKAAGKELDDRCAIYVATRIFEALAAAHSSVDEAGVMAPVIHRDVNPSNVLIPWDGSVKVADFGVAKIVGLSAAGMLKGTYGYMAPEQVKGDLVTPRSDVYAAGIILWEMLTKRRAFQRGALPEVEALRAMAEPRLVSIDVVRPDLDRSIRDAAKRALEPRADRRTITAEEMVSVLSNVVPAAEGQERLVAVLNSVKSIASSSLSSLPPPMLGARGAADADTVPQTIQGAPPPPPVPQGGGGRLPRPVAPPRPATAAKLIAGASPPALPSSANRAGVLRSTLASPSAGQRESNRTAPSQQSSERPRRPSASAWLAVSAPDTSDAPTQEVSATQSFIDALVKSTVPGAGEREANELELGTPLEAIASGRRLDDAIDEILGESRHGPPRSARRDSAPTLTGVSSMLAEAAASSKAAEAASDRLAPSPAHAQRTSRGERAEADAGRGDPTEAAEVAPSTSRMIHAPPDRMGERGAGNASTEPLASPSTRINTEPMPQYVRPLPSPPSPIKPAEPPFPPSVVIDASALPPSPPEQPGAPSEATSVAVGRDDAGSPWDAPKRTKGGGGAIAAFLLLAVAAGIAGTVAYVRYQKSDVEDVPTPVATLANVPSSSPSSLASLATSASPPSESPVASASSAEGVAPASASSAEGDAATESAPSAPSLASATPSGSAPSEAPPEGLADAPSGATTAPATGAASADATDVPPTMGVIKTTGAAPGRRIFVDKKAVGQTPASVTVKCGPRTVRLGSAGKPQSVDVPCGGQISVSDKF